VDPMDDELWWSTLLAARKDMYSTEDERYVAYGVWQDRPSYGDGVPTATSWWRNSIGGINHQTVVAPKVAGSAAANPIREHPPVWNKGADTASTPSREDSAQADAYTDVLADDWSQAEFSLGRHRREREVVLSPRRLTGAAVFLAGQKRSAVADEWRSHLSDLIRQGLSSRGDRKSARL